MAAILCYGDSNTWGCIPLRGSEPARRFPPETRWPGVLRRELGDGHWVVEEGLNGRTTVWDDPLEPHRNGRTLLPPTLLTHQPPEFVDAYWRCSVLSRFHILPSEFRAMVVDAGHAQCTYTWVAPPAGPRLGRSDLSTAFIALTGQVLSRQSYHRAFSVVGRASR